MCSSADASLPPLQATAHGSGSMWIATPSSYRTCTDYSLPVSRRTAKDSGHYQGMAENGERAKRGGDRKSKSRGVTLKLDVTKMQSSRAKPYPVIAERTGAADRARIGSGGVLRFMCFGQQRSVA